MALTAARSAVAAETDPNRLAFLNARMSLGQALYLSGRPAEARPSLEAAISAPLAAKQPAGWIIALAYLGLVWLAAGADDRAEDLARRAMQEAAAVGLADHPGLWHAPLALGRVLLHQGRVPEAEAVLVPGLEHRLHELHHTPLAHAFALLTLAALRQGQGQQFAARSLLDEVQSVIARCADAGILTHLLAERLPVMPHHQPVGVAQHEHLSESELRILRLLATDLNQREIGRELYLSVNTVKTHTRAIYGKLGARSRQNAIARARALGLIA
jgi:LuxR family maltose regulon positive regulatory protein